jgi:hypothetical protein
MKKKKKKKKTPPRNRIQAKDIPVDTHTYKNQADRNIAVMSVLAEVCSLQKDTEILLM